MRQKRNAGDILSIDLGEGTFAFARVLDEPLMAFYDLNVGVPVLAVDQVIARPVLWRLWVMNYAVTRGRWRIIGNASLEEWLREEPTFFKQDSITSRLSHYREQQEVPATLEQCLRLERAAVWDPEHVEDRLRDQFSGRLNKWVESLRVKTPEPAN